MRGRPSRQFQPQGCKSDLPSPFHFWDWDPRSGVEGGDQAGDLGAGAVGGGGCEWLRWSVAGLRCVSSARLRCTWTVWTIVERPAESEAGVERDPGGRSPEVGCGRDGRRRMTALVNNWEAVRLLSSASLRGDAEGRRWASSHTHLFWAKCSAQDVAPITHRPSAAGGRYGASVVARTSGRGHVSEV